MAAAPMDSQANRPIRLPTDLAASMVFDEHDVLANRVGVLSEWQRQRLDRALELDARRFPRMLAVFVVLAVGAVAAAVVSSGASPAVIGALAAALAVPVTLVVWMSSRRTRSRARMASPQVVSSVGVPDASPAMTPGYWNVRIGHVTVQLDGGTVAMLSTRQPLRAFTADLGPGSPTLLSAELIDES